MTTPDSTGRDRRRRDAADCLLTSLVIFCNYLLSAPRSVMLDDDGFFIMAAWFNGVSHPPGYPLYTFLAHLGTFLPFGSVAFRVHLVSALFGALACACVWKLARLLFDSRLYAYAAALAFGFSRTFWSQSIIAEVYSLNVLFLSGLLLLAVIYAREPGPGSRPGWIAFLYGLSLSNHWPLMLLSTPGLAVVLWPRRRELLGRWPALFGLALLGLTPYLWMVYRSQVSEISLFGPIENVSDFWDYLSRRAYSSVDHSVTSGWTDKLRFAGFALRETAGQFGPLSVPLLAWGAVRQAREWPGHVWIALVLVFVACTFVLVGLLDFDYDLLNRNVFFVYPLPAYAAAVLWMVLGLKALNEWLSARSLITVRQGFFQGGVTLLLVLSIWISNAPANLRARDNWAGDYAATTLMALPPRAVFFVFGDYVTAPVGYLNRVEGLRRDVTLMSVNGLLFRNRLVRPGAWSPDNSRPVFEKFIINSDRPIHYFPFLPQRFGSVFYGLHFEVLKEGPPRLRRIIGTPPVLEFFDRMFLRGEPRDTSELILYRYLTGWYCNLAAGILEHSSANPAASGLSGALESRCGGYYGLVRRAEAMLAKDGPDTGAVLELLRRAQQHADEAVQVRDLATLYHLFGRTYQVAGDKRMAESYYSRSLSSFPSRTNPANAYFEALRRGPAGD